MNWISIAFAIHSVDPTTKRKNGHNEVYQVSSNKRPSRSHRVPPQIDLNSYVAITITPLKDDYFITKVFGSCQTESSKDDSQVSLIINKVFPLI